MPKRLAIRAKMAQQAATSYSQLTTMMQAALERANEREGQVPVLDRARVRDRWAAIDGDCREAEQARQATERIWRVCGGHQESRRGKPASPISRRPPTTRPQFER